jgi:hypothetical protein
MDNKIKQILKDIYSVDKSLKSKEEYLIQIIQELLLSKPADAIDENFVAILKAKVLEKSQSLKETKQMFKFSFAKLSYAVAGMAVILLAVMVFVNNPEQQMQGLVVAKTGDNAFGDIAFGGDISEEGDQRESTFSGNALGMGGSDNDEETKSSPSATGNGASVDSMIAPEMINYNYVYDGEDFQVENGKVTVYKKLQGSSDSLSSVLNGLRLNDVDLSKFSNLKVASMQLSEDKDHGYAIYVYPKENTIYISQNWQKWPEYYRDEQTSVSQLSNEKALEIANNFLEDYNINTSAYGPGEVLEYPSGEGYSRDSATVVYPLQVEGKDVYNQSGFKHGLNVIVDFRTGRVSNVSNINPGNFQSSDYDSSLTKEQAISYAEKGGLQRNYLYEEATKTVDIKLGTPIYSLVQTWKYDENNSSELLVPSLIFPVKNIQDYRYYYGSYVIVPLVGDLMNQGLDAPVGIMKDLEE